MNIPIRFLTVASVGLLLASCGNNSTTTQETTSLKSTIADVSTDVPPTSECPTGGAVIYSGIDENGDGVLQTTERDKTHYVCNGTAGTDGAAGATGSAGLDGRDLTVKPGIEATKMNFVPVQVPLTTADQATNTVSDKVIINGETQNIGLTKLLATGDVNNSETYGQVKDYQDNAIQFGDASPYICNGTNAGVGSGLDYVSLLNKNNKLYMVSQFECQIGAMYVNEVDQDPLTGALSVKDNSLKYVSQKDGFGGFVHCAGQTTPWQSHLGSEEYENNARAVEADADATTGLTGNKYYDETAKYWGDDATKMSPYYYGWTPEVSIDASGNAVYAKHYSMGRMSHELSYVMPDQKTVYMSDDGTNVGLFMYVADAPQDLSSGTLYAAKWLQLDDVNGGNAYISWVNLGSATDAEIKTILDADSDVNTNDAPVFSDIFAAVDPDTSNACATGYTSINTSTGQECLKLKLGTDRSSKFADDAAVEKAAAFLETRRYAALKGATTEFRKEEGITFDADHNRLYVAMSEIRKGMEDASSSDTGGNNDIRLPANACGGVYALDVANGPQKDTDGGSIASAFVVNTMYGIITGKPKTYADSSLADNTCDVNGISNPDNISYLDGSNILTIGEDTGSHKNNMVWAFDVENGSLKRMFTTPIEAESTSAFWHKNINGYGYMTAVTQHPAGDTSESYISVIGPFENLSSLKGGSLSKLGSYRTGTEGGAEISDYDPTSKKIFITNGAANKIDVVDASNPKMLSLSSQIDLSAYGASVQSVSVKNGKVAVAVGSADKTTTVGKVAVFDTSGTLLSLTQVGYLPDMVTFNDDGTKIVVANEGEPKVNEPYTTTADYIDVNGTVGLIDVASATTTDDATGYAEVDFSAATLTASSDGTAVRLGATPSNDQAKDIEPEYITVSGNTAWVSLQENNAIAKADISGTTPTLTLVKSLGAKSYASGNKIDIEEEGKIMLKNYPELYGMYMPDTIASYQYGGKTYIVTANEGDGREYIDSNDDGFVDEKKISKLTLDSSIADAYANENDLKVMVDLGGTTTDGSGTYSKLYTYGARSFTIWDEDANMVWDSGDQFSRKIATLEPALFNQDDGEIDGRSGNKGVEPEALTVGEVNGRVLAFIGLERQSGIMVYDITNPWYPKYVGYTSTQMEGGDVSPEGMKFISPMDSPNGKPLLLVSFEVSGSTTLFEIK